MSTQARVRDIPTWQMTSEELARVWAAHHDLTGRTGGWLYDPQGRPVCHGYGDLAQILTRHQIIEPGAGVHWIRSEHLGGVRFVREQRRMFQEDRPTRR